ncbi:MAG: hypothetical protein ACNS62_08710 [Candidatus Cyclobacteriaceae bacterium M3_2C_046]
MEESIKQKKINDINAIDFGSEVREVISSLEILILMLEIDDDKEVIGACKKRLQEGIALLKSLDPEQAKRFG